MRRLVALFFGLTIAMMEQVHCNGDVGPGHNRANDLGEDVVQLKTVLKHMKRQLCRVMNSQRDFQKVRDNCKEALEKAENYFINSPLQQELQSIKREQDTLNISVSATRQDLLSTRSEMKMVTTSVNVTGEDVLSVMSKLTQVQASLKEAELDMLSTKSDMKMVQASVNATDKDVQSMKSELTQVQASLTDAERDILSTKSELKMVQASVNVTDAELDGVCCPDEFRHHEDSCYWFSTFKKNFTSARSFCEDKESQLAIITSVSENNFVKNYVAKHGKAGAYWLGGSDVDTEGEWKWEGGTPIVDPDWMTHQPDDFGSEEDCLMLSRSFGYRWNDWPCQNEANFICEASHF